MEQQMHVDHDAAGWGAPHLTGVMAIPRFRQALAALKARTSFTRSSNLDSSCRRKHIFIPPAACYSCSFLHLQPLQTRWVTMHTTWVS